MRRREALRLLGLSTMVPMVSRCGLPDFPSAGAQSGELDGLPAAGQTTMPDLDLRLTAAPDEMTLLGGDATRVWRFSGEVVTGPAGALQPAAGSYLGPTIRVTRGQRVRVRFRNGLDEPSIVHWHGLDVPEDADGHPRLAIAPAGEYVYEFTVTNRAGTYWYHPHPHMRTGPQVYMGLAGLLIVDDEEERALELPGEQSELFCVLQDRTFDAANQLVYPAMDEPAARGRGMGGMRGRGGMAAMMALENGVLGDRVLVNGRPDAVLDVEAGWVRARLLNGSNARVYKLAWHDGRPMTVIGSDGGLLGAALTRNTLTLGPAQRADVLLNLSDLGQDDRLRLVSLPFPAGDAGHMEMMMMGGASGPPQGTAMDVMTLRARGKNTRAVRLPDRLSAFSPASTPVGDAPVRQVSLSFRQMQWLLDGRVFEMDEVSAGETVAAGSTHIWEFVNTTNPMGMEAAHPIHLHGRQFRVLGRAGGASSNALRPGLIDAGWTDTVLVLPGETVRTQVTFSEHKGLFLYHCHVLEHEDMGMMRNFRVV